MATLNNSPAPDPKRVASATRLLAAAIAADTAQATERLVDTLITKAERSTKWTDAVFAAVQSLRDMASIDPPEAVWLLSELGDVHLERVRENDPVINQAMDEHHAESYRVHGEDALADPRLSDPDKCISLQSEGEQRFVHDKFTPFHDLNTTPDPVAVARVTERVIAMAAAETLPDCFAAWRELNEVLHPYPRNDERPPNVAASGIAAAQTLRSLGVITEREAAHLIDDGVSGTAWVAAEGDRTCQRLWRAMDAIERAHGLEDGASFPNCEEPAEWLALDREYSRRYDGFTAVCLRRFGEHGLARLLVENPAEYRRMVDDFGVGVIWADH